MNSVPAELQPYVFQPGQSGNTNGRPKGALSLRKRLQNRLRANPEEADAIVHALLRHAYNGDAAMMKLVIDGVDGPQALKIEGLSVADITARLSVLLETLRARLPEQYHPIIAEVALETLGDG